MIQRHAPSPVLAALLGMTLLAGCDDGGGSKPPGGSGGTVGSTACKPAAQECYVDGSEGPGSECLAKADFSGAADGKTQLRITQHEVAKPNTLAKPYVQEAIITKKSALEQPACNQYGLGQFNLLLEIDTQAGTLTLGGGVPQSCTGGSGCTEEPVDPKNGTCWASFASGTLQVRPKQATTTTEAGKLRAEFDSFVMPIYLENKTNADSYVLVPLQQMTLEATLSDDRNCIGRYAHERLDPAFKCKPDVDEFGWDNGGVYRGTITVAEADDVFVHSLGQSLCVVLSGDPSTWKGTENTCRTSEGFTKTGALPKGDWCAGTNSAGGCEDAWRLEIQFAAHAIRIRGEYDEASGGC
jgi:hypothetical protein